MKADSCVNNYVIPSAEHLTTEVVDVSDYWPEPGQVLVSEMSANARDELEQYMARLSEQQSGKKKSAKQQTKQDESYRHIRAMLCAFCIVNENRERIFTPQEVEQLGKKNSRVLDRIFDVANRLNKVFGYQREDAEKNSETTPDEEEGGG